MVSQSIVHYYDLMLLSFKQKAYLLEFQLNLIFLSASTRVFVSSQFFKMKFYSISFPVNFLMKQEIITEHIVRKRRILFVSCLVTILRCIFYSYVKCVITPQIHKAYASITKFLQLGVILFTQFHLSLSLSFSHITIKGPSKASSSLRIFLVNSE